MSNYIFQSAADARKNRVPIAKRKPLSLWLRLVTSPRYLRDGDAFADLIGDKLGAALERLDRRVEAKYRRMGRTSSPEMEVNP